MSYRVVLFDLDGTVADTIDLIVASGQHAVSTVLGWTPAREELLRHLGRPLHQHLGEYASSPEQLEELITAYRAYQVQHHDDMTRPYDGVNDVVRWLSGQGRPLGIVTSKVEFLADRALRLLGIDQLFSVVVGLNATTRHKPEPEPVLFAMRQLGAEPHETVYVGDSPFDLMSASGAGTASIAVTWGAFSEATLSEQRPTHIARSAAELRAVLQ